MERWENFINTTYMNYDDIISQKSAIHIAAIMQVTY